MPRDDDIPISPQNDPRPGAMPEGMWVDYSARRRFPATGLSVLCAASNPADLLLQRVVLEDLGAVHRVEGAEEPWIGVRDAVEAPNRYDLILITGTVCMSEVPEHWNTSGPLLAAVGSGPSSSDRFAARLPHPLRHAHCRRMIEALFVADRSLDPEAPLT